MHRNCEVVQAVLSAEGLEGHVRLLDGLAPTAQADADSALEAFGEVGAAGGIPYAVFPTTYAELPLLTGGTPAAVA